MILSDIEILSMMTKSSQPNYLRSLSNQKS